MHVIIIGGGASGLLVAVWCAKLGKSGDKVTLIDAVFTSRLGAGQAYAGDTERFLLNVRAAGMSAYPEQMSHFVDWLRAHKGYADAEGFVPRCWYAEYLQDVYRTEVATSAVHVVHHQQAAVSLDGESRCVRCADGSEVHGDAIVLALGNLPPANPLRAWKSNPAYMVDWYDFDPKAVHSDDPVVCIGTGLTMVDQVIALHATGYTGKIVAISRHGNLPQVHVARQSYPSPLTEADAAQDVSQVVGKMRTAIATAATQGVPWQAVVDSIRPHTRGIWRQWGAHKQKRFLRHARALWDIHRHRMAPEISQLINHLITSGQLDIVRGRICAYVETDQGGVVTYVHPHGSGEITSRHIVNCTGPANQYTAQPVLRDMAKSQGVVADQHGLGVRVDEHGQLVDGAGNTAAGLWAIGPMRKGTDWECTAIPDIRNQAHDIARSVMLVEVPTC